MLLSQDDEIVQPLGDVTPTNGLQLPPKKRGGKRTRILLDANTELSDEELKVMLFVSLSFIAITKRS